MSGFDFNLAVRATGIAYRDCIRSASRSLLRNWEVLIGMLIGSVLFLLAARLLAVAGITGRFLTAILADALLAYYYGWLAEMARGNKVTWRGLRSFDWGLFFSIISVSFILYLIWLFSSPLAHDPESRHIVSVVSLAVVFLFNAIPEAIYIHRYEGFTAFSVALNFIKENWIEWYLPFVLLLAPFVYLSPSPIYFLLTLAVVGPLFPSTIFILGIGVILPGASFAAQVIVGALIAHWFMLFRGFLFIELESGNRRQRIYRAKQR